MYYYVEATMLGRHPSDGWGKTDIVNLTMGEITKRYRDGLVTVNNVNLGGRIHLELDTILTQGVRMDKTLQWWLANLKNTYVPHLKGEFKIVNDRANYRDGYAAGYRVRSVNYAIHPDTELPLSSRPDLLLTNPTIGKEFINNRTLVTVNGWFHRTFSHPQGNIIDSGGLTVRHGGNNTFGVWSFNNVGVVKQSQFVIDDITPVSEGGKLKDGLVFKTSLDLVGRTLGVCIGGIIHLLDGTSKIINEEESLVYLDMSKIDIYTRINNQIDEIPLTSLPIPTSGLNRRAFSYKDVMSDDCILAYLTLPQSFIFTIDSDTLYVDKTPYEYSGYPGSFFDSGATVPRDLVQTSIGNYPALVMTRETDKWVMFIDRPLATDYAYRTTNYKEQRSWDGTPRIDRKYYPNLLSRVRVGSEYITFDVD